jgi:hypothetical protein
MTGLNLLYTDIETDLRASLRRLLADRCQPTAVAAAYEGDRSLATAVWKSLSHEMGLAGLLVPADRGGAGASAREAAVTLEELGRAIAPVPFLTSSVIATVTLLAAEAGSAADELLAALASGEAVAALAVPLTAAEGDAPAPRCWRRSSSGSRSGAWRRPSPTSRSADSSAARSGASRRSSTGSPTCSHSWRRPPPRQGTRRPPSPRATRISPSRCRSDRPAAVTPPYAPRRRPSSSTAAWA